MAERAPYTRRGRCVHCGLFGQLRGESCKYSPDGHATLDLPEGKTCGDCVHLTICKGIFGRIAADESCDFYPIRFRAAKLEVSPCQS